ncbi:hypothetical protein R9C00_23015 [Flammeovirgaceae bacterium SG7u.111]|nr:hypothetical protein [Flammeovirgaceae bacterium SG7u.132]WPO34576.1 hypothetical protein R9C00_23015 [Flammeovirgaceae bacterium SG7u.111]
MSKVKIDKLQRLIKSLKKSEKRYFKLLMAKEGAGGQKKFVRLFDLIEKNSQADDAWIKNQEPSFKSSQLPNLKAHLYSKILQSLRMYYSSQNPEIEIRELLDSAVILYNRCLYDQCAEVLRKAKRKAQKIEALELLLDIYKWEKSVMGHTFKRGNQERVNTIVSEVQEVNNRINIINKFTNLSAKLNSIYLRVGFIRDEESYRQIKLFFRENLPDFKEEELSFREKLHLYDLQVGYCFFIQDFKQGHFYAKKWVEMIEESGEFTVTNLEMYIKGINNLMIAQYKLFFYHDFVETNKKLKSVRKIPGLDLNENILVRLYKYIYVHEFNRYFMLGDFDVGVERISRITNNLEKYVSRLDKHSQLIMYYKIACLYFGNSNYHEVIFWLNKVINTQEIDLREDVHCFARIVMLISHYELGNTDVIDYYIRATYRFLLKKDDLHNFQKYILGFMKNLTKDMTEEELILRFKNLRSQLLPLENSRYEKRAFIYFDIVSWLDCKIEKVPVQEVVKRKARVITEQPLPVLADSDEEIE